MTATVTSVYDVLDTIKNEVDCLCAKENVSPLLVWLVLRQQADYQLLLLSNPTRLNLCPLAGAVFTRVPSGASVPLPYIYR